MLGDQLAGEELPDHLDGLFQHVQPVFGGRPPGARDVLVQRFTAAHPEGEPAVAEQR